MTSGIKGVNIFLKKVYLKDGDDLDFFEIKNLLAIKLKGYKMKKSTYFKYLMKVLITPSCWVRSYQTSEVNDEKLLDLLKKHKFKKIDNSTASLGGVVFWVGNHPYSSFFLIKASALTTKEKMLPKRTTVLYAYDRLLEDTIGDKHV